jgi:hypothetical protein
MRAKSRPKTKAERELLADMRQEFTVAEYNYLLEGTDDSMKKYQQARAWITYMTNVKVDENVS